MIMRASKNAVRWTAALVAVAGILPFSARAADDLPLRAMQDELARSTAQLRLEGMEKPYFISYRMEEVDGFTISAELGSLTSAQPTRARRIGVELRVGDHALDNGNYVGGLGRFGGLGGLVAFATAPLDDDYQQLRRQLWLTTDAQYKKALEDLSAKRAALRSRARAESLPDFTPEAPLTVTAARARPCPPRAEAEALVRELSAVFRSAPEVRGSSVTLACQDLYVRYVNTDGTSFTRATPQVKLEIRADAQAASAIPVSDDVVLFGRSLADLPSREKLLARTRALAERVLALRRSASVERYNGPVLFEGGAAAEVFAQQFAPALVGVRQPTSDDPRFDMLFGRLAAQLGGGTFSDRIGGRVLPAFLSVTNDPLREDLGGVPLLGGYRVDDDGVAARATKLVDHGTLRTLLTTRVPVPSVLRSTGSRRGASAAPGNLRVTSERTLSSARLRKELLRRAKERGLDFAIVVRHVGGSGASPFLRLAARAADDGAMGSTAMSEVYRVFPDGREELLHGMEIAELTAAAFKDIAAAGDSPAVHSAEFFGGISAVLGGPGAHGLPVVSCAVPALLFEEVALVKSRGPFPEQPVTPSPLAKR
jgi:hypothetical protein